MEQRIILICEDDELLLRILTLAVKAIGYRSETAESTDELFKKLEEFHPDLIILDLNIPEQGGAYVVKELRKSEGNREIPVILCSGTPELPMIADELHVTGYLHKPFGIPEFHSVLNSVFQETTHKD